MEETIRFLLFIAFTGLLLLLRLDAARFGAAEYDDETAPGGVRTWLRRLAWYVLGIGLVYAIYNIYRLPISVLHLHLGNDRQQAILLGLAFGLGGTLVAFLIAWWRYRRFRLPPLRHYPGAILNAIGTSIIDEALFRGVIMGLMLSFGWQVELAIGAQALLYGVATRLGAPGRSKQMLLLSVVLGVVAGYLTVITGGIGAAVVGHALTRFAVFLATGHAGQLRGRGREPEEELGWSMPPEGWEIVVDPDTAGAPVTSGRLRQVRPGS